MTGIVCLDQEDGLLFNGRRQSRDRVVTEKILSMTEGKPLWMSAYSRRIFPEDAPVCVPAAVGFGIHTPDQAAEISKTADGVIVGSAVVKLIEKYGSHAGGHLYTYVRMMKDAVSHSK